MVRSSAVTDEAASAPRPRAATSKREVRMVGSLCLHASRFPGARAAQRISWRVARGGSLNPTLALPGGPGSSADSEVARDALWKRGLDLHRRALVVDTHSDTPSCIVDDDVDAGRRNDAGHMDLVRMAEGGLDAEFFSIYVAAQYVELGGAARRALELIDAVRALAAAHP